MERVGNDFMITCEAIGYPSVVIEWLDSSGNVITADQTVIPTPGVFEQSVRNILTVRDGNCQDPYVCRACNGECSSAIRTSRSVRICIPGESTVCLLCECEHLCVCVCERLCLSVCVCVCV